jgi:hypothetical protein
MGFSIFPAANPTLNGPVPRQTFTSSGSVTIPSGTNMVYGVLYGSGTGGYCGGSNAVVVFDGDGYYTYYVPYSGSTGTYGTITVGLTPVATNVVVGSGGAINGGSGGNSHYGALAASGGQVGFWRGSSSGSTVAQPLLYGGLASARFTDDGLPSNTSAAGNAGGSGTCSGAGVGGPGAVVLIY